MFCAHFAARHDEAAATALRNCIENWNVVNGDDSESGCNSASFEKICYQVSDDITAAHDGALRKPIALAL